MAKLTTTRIEKILAQQLALKDPQYRLEIAGNRVVGSVISSSFKGKADHKRQTMIWEALDEELGPRSVVLVGMILAYTPEEWNLGAEDKPTTTKSRKVG